MDIQLTENLHGQGYLSTYVDKLAEELLLSQFFAYARKMGRGYLKVLC